MRNGPAGEQKNAPSCSSTRLTVTSGLMSPYPPGLELPEVDKRPACTDVWPPVYAADDAKPVGKWTIVSRPDGRKQWAYDGYALYTSSLDLKPGDVLGASRLRRGADSPAYRMPISPPPLVPPQFQVVEQRSGRFLVTGNGGMSVYAWNKDGPEKSSCRSRCEEIWAPVLAPALAKPQGEFTIFERAPGVKQWAFRKQPLYTHVIDDRPHALNGEGRAGVVIVYTQQPRAWPAGFTEQVTPGGMVLADARGKTLYIYACADDALDQLACDHPSTPQAYRFAVCGGGKPERCVQYFPYVIAPTGCEERQRVVDGEVDRPRDRQMGPRHTPRARCTSGAIAIARSTRTCATRRRATSKPTPGASSTRTAMATRLSGCAMTS